MNDKEYNILMGFCVVLGTLFGVYISWLIAKHTNTLEWWL